MLSMKTGEGKKHWLLYNIYMGVTYIELKTRGLYFFKSVNIRYFKPVIDMVLPPRLHRHYSIDFSTWQPLKSMLL